MDFFPTFAKLADAATPEGHQIDGMDIMPLLKGDTKRAERVLHWLFADSWAVRRGPWKLIGTNKNAHALMNIENDMEEKRDLFNLQSERVNELMKLHEDWIKVVGKR